MKPLTLYGSVGAFIARHRELYNSPTNKVLKARHTIDHFVHWLTVEDTDDFSLVTNARILIYLRDQRRSGMKSRQISTCESILQEWQVFLSHYRENQPEQKGRPVRTTSTKKKSTEQAPPLTDKELDSILHQESSSTKPEHIMASAGIVLMHECGFTSDILRTLTMKEINWEEGSLTVRNKSHILTEMARSALVRYLEAGRPGLIAKLRWVRCKPAQFTLVFLGHRGGIVSDDWPASDLRRRAASAGITKEVNITHFLRSAKARKKTQ